MAESGEDAGRLVHVAPTGLDTLPEQAMSDATSDTTGRIGHAVALFRARGASVDDRRSAVIVLAGIIEERRDLLKASLINADEGALFNIANNFAVRHQRADQYKDYDPVFLDWVFWCYLATVQLTSVLLAHLSSQ